MANLYYFSGGGSAAMADESTRRCQGRAAGANANCPSTMEGGGFARAAVAAVGPAANLRAATPRQ